MTNQEWLAEMTPEEWWETVYWLTHVYGKRETDTRLAVMDWLTEQHDEGR